MKAQIPIGLRRAPGTPLSRRDRAGQLYRGHIEAAAQLGFAQRTLSAEQLKPLWLVLDAGAETVHLDDQPIHCEQLALKLSDNSILKLPAAWVITVGNQQPVAQLLYLPSRPVPVQVFDQRSDMEHWLSAQLLAPPALPSHYSFQYTTRTGPLTTGITDLFSPAPQGRFAEAFAQAPSLEDLELTEDFGDEDQSSLFDNLSADIPLALRQASLGNNVRRWKPCWGMHSTVTVIRRSTTHSRRWKPQKFLPTQPHPGLLYRARVLDLTTFNREFNALYQAHKDGLKAEAELQRALNQLDSAEFEWLKVLLDTPDAAAHDPGVAFASLWLNMRTDTGDHSRQALSGAIGHYPSANAGRSRLAAQSAALLARHRRRLAAVRQPQRPGAATVQDPGTGPGAGPAIEKNHDRSAAVQP